MKIIELENVLHEMGIPKQFFNLTGQGLRDNTLCLVYSEKQWEVFFYERGQKCALRTFATEEDAANEILRRLTLYKLHNP